jgi:glycosyltransferase involved in cell wall biosynthesis
MNATNEDFPARQRQSSASAATVTVVIPAHNAEATIDEQLAALAAQTYEGAWELVVSDDGSTDRTVEKAQAWADRLPSLRVISSPERRGASHARNAGAASTGELIAFCDADDVAAPTWLAELVAATNGYDLVGGALEHSMLNERAISDARGGQTAELQQTYGFLPFAVGGNLAVRREVWSAIGGWERSYSRGEDVEFCWRAQLSGYSIAFAPRAVMHCRHRDSQLAGARQVVDYARAEVQLYKQYRAAGARRRRASEIVRSYAYLVTRLPFLVMSRRRRNMWLVGAANNLGRIWGSIEHRVFAP